MVAITGNVSSALIGSDAFQEADITGITMPITKHNWLVTDVKDLPRILKEAFYIARTGRPGPVLVDIPKDVQNAELEFEYPETVNIPGYHPPVREEPRLKDAAALIRAASRPVIYLGGGVRTSSAYAEVAQFAELVGRAGGDHRPRQGRAPRDPPAVPGHVRHARRQVRQLHGPGLGPDHRAGRPLRRPRHRQALDLRPRGQDRPPGHRPGRDLQAGDAPPSRWWATSSSCSRSSPQEIRKAFAASGRADIAPWLKKVADWREKHPLRYAAQGDEFIEPQYVIERIWEKTQGKALVTTGVGEHQMFAAQYWKTTQPRQFITSGGLGTMGFCLPGRHRGAARQARRARHRHRRRRVASR